MVEESFDNSLFRDITTPEAAARELAACYGERATDAATSAAFGARADGRDGDYRFWLAVLARLRPTGAET